MEDLAAVEPVSTTIDTEAGPSQSGAGTPPLPDPKPEEPRSLRDDLRASLKSVDREGAKPAEDKPEAAADKADHSSKDAKPAAQPGAEKKDDATDAETESDQEPDEREPEERDDRTNRTPPSRFLPIAKEQWRNVPRAVRAEVARMETEYAAEREHLTKSNERYESIRPFDELARTNGRDLRESLQQINQVENLMRQSPVAGLNAILAQIGPRKADGQPLTVFEVARHIMEQGEPAFQQHMMQVQGQQQREQPNREVEALRAQVAQMRDEKLHETVIEPFRASHDRFDELQQPIALFLKSGMVPDSLSPAEKLATAYDMAVRQNPAPVDRRAADVEPAHDRRADDFGGTKSIKSAPGSVSEDIEFKPKSGESLRDGLRAELRRQRRT